MSPFREIFKIFFFSNLPDLQLHYWIIIIISIETFSSFNINLSLLSKAIISYSFFFVLLCCRRARRNILLLFFFAKVFCVCFVDRIEKNYDYVFFWASLNVIMGSFIYFISISLFRFQSIEFHFHISLLLLHAIEKDLAECFLFVKF